MRQPLYRAESDPYCCPNSDVLKNKAGLTPVEALAQFETAMTFARSEEPLPSGRCSVRHYRSIHKHLFQDVYEWAGRFRSVRLTKGSSTFCYPENIAAEMSRIFAWLRHERHLRDRSVRGFCEGAAHLLAEINAIHPFREGNGRTQLTFLVVLADQAGHAIALDRLDPDVTLDAMIRSFQGDERSLAALVELLAS